MTEGVDALIQSDLRPAETICKFSIVLSEENKILIKYMYICKGLYFKKKVNYDYVSKMCLNFSYLVTTKIKPPRKKHL